MDKAVGEKELCDGDSGAACSVYHNAAVLLCLSCHLQGIDDACQDHDGRAVLIVVEDRDGEAFL